MEKIPKDPKDSGSLKFYIEKNPKDPQRPQRSGIFKKYKSFFFNTKIDEFQINSHYRIIFLQYIAVKKYFKNVLCNYYQNLASFSYILFISFFQFSSVQLTVG